MSTVQTNRVQHSSGAGDNIRLEADGNVIFAGDLQASSFNGAGLGRNQLINGDFSTWARGDGSFTAQFGYTTDRWYLALGGGSIQRARDVGVPSGNTIQVDSDATIGQLVELPVMNNGNCSPGPFMPGTTWTFSYYSSNDSLTTAQTNMSFREGSTDDSPTLISDVVTFALTGEEIVGANRTYYRYSATMTVIDDAEVGDNEGMLVTIPAEAGEWLAMAQLEPGSKSTPFQHIPVATSLSLCQRYYEAVLPNGVVTYYGGCMAPAAGFSGKASCDSLQFKVRKRAVPTVVMYAIDLGSGAPANQLHVQDTNAGGNRDIEDYTVTTDSVTPEVSVQSQSVFYRVISQGYTADAEL